MEKAAREAEAAEAARKAAAAAEAERKAAAEAAARKAAEPAPITPPDSDPRASAQPSFGAQN